LTELPAAPISQKHEPRDLVDDAMKNLTIALDEGVHQKSRLRAAATGQSMSRYVAQLIENDVRHNPPLTDEEKRRRLDALQRLFDAPKIAISENGRMPNADERNARR
jgi:plasmid stability protein